MVGLLPWLRGSSTVPHSTAPRVSTRRVERSNRAERQIFSQLISTIHQSLEPPRMIFSRASFSLNQEQQLETWWLAESGLLRMGGTLSRKKSFSDSKRCKGSCGVDSLRTKSGGQAHLPHLRDTLVAWFGLI